MHIGERKENEMRDTIYVVKRSNGFYEIYKNGKSQVDLVSNLPLYASSEMLINSILMESKFENPKIIFTDKEIKFKSNLPNAWQVFIKSVKSKMKRDKNPNICKPVTSFDTKKFVFLLLILMIICVVTRIWFFNCLYASLGIIR